MAHGPATQAIEAFKVDGERPHSTGTPNDARTTSSCLCGTFEGHCLAHARWTAHEDRLPARVSATGPGQSFALLLDVIKILHAQGVDYAVIGGLAASAHGVVRGSLDADALLSVSESELSRLAAIFKDLGYKTTLRYGEDGDPIKAFLALEDHYENRVDLLIGIRGFDPTAFARTISIGIGAQHLRIVGLEDFIAMKIFAGGPQDIMDAQKAIAVSGDQLDRSLVEKVTEGFGRKYLKPLKSLLEQN
jgi:predicted nucleotidyltransferase